MNSTKIKKAEEIFQLTADLPLEERKGVLTQRCGGDDELRGFVERLLSNHVAGMGEFMRRPVFAPAPDDTVDEEAPLPERIRRYAILRKIGEGGMGVVYLAEQSEPIHRQVALKIIKLGMDTKQVVARFESERQALAMMNHPNVAKVLDAGATEQGRPFFVMEYVPGISITDYCDRHRLSTPERLRLHIQVCQAVQHAHQKGIIHRDIKASNVLVAIEEGEPAAKMIDFGVARATQHRLTEMTLLTEQGQLIGTPEYMSPEQAEMTNLDVDTRTDVYSLGVLLYELLAGTLPFERASLRKAGLGEIQRLIREQEPSKPSARLSSLGIESAAIADKRRTDRTSLERQLRGDLDWITMKAMEKDRTRRYATAAELADDVARHLGHEPVLAGPPSAAYRLSKFVRRNRRSVAAGLAFVVVLSIGLVATISLYVQAKRAWTQSDRSRAQAEAVTEFLMGTLASVDPAEARGREVTVKEMLDKSAAQIPTAFIDQPLVGAVLRTTLGNTYRALGEYPSAALHLEAALSIRRQVLGNEHSDVADAMNDLAAVLDAQGDYESAERLFRRALALRCALYDSEHPDVLQSQRNLGLLLYRRGDYAGAEPVLREVLAIRRKQLGNEHHLVAETLNILAVVVKRQGDYSGAERLYAEALATWRKSLGDDHPKVAQVLNNLGNVLRHKGNLQSAESRLREALAIRRKVHPDQHPKVAVTLNSLGAVLLDKGDYDGAEQRFLEALAIRRSCLDRHHPKIASVLNNLAVVQIKKGDHTAAETLAREAVAIQRKRAISNDRNLGYFLGTLGESLMGKGDAAEAEPVLCELLEILRAVLPSDDAQIVNTERLLGRCLTKLGRYKEAEQVLVDRYTEPRPTRASSDEYVVAVLHEIIELYEAWGKPREAAQYQHLLTIAEEPNPKE